MAVAIRTTDFPEGVGASMYDGVQAAIDIASDPPEGLIFHWAGEVDGKWTITTFGRRARHMTGSAMTGFLRRSGRSPEWIPLSGPQLTITEFVVHNFVKP